MFRNEVGLRTSRGLSADDLAMEAGGAANLERARAGRLSTHNMFENQMENELENRRPQAGRGSLAALTSNHSFHLLTTTLTSSQLLLLFRRCSRLCSTTPTSSPPI